MGRLRELGVEIHLGSEEETLLQGIDLVVKSPGVPGETMLVDRARTRGVPVWSEIELGARAPSEPDSRRHRHEREDDDDGAPRCGVPRRPGDPCEVAGNVGRPLTSLVGAASPDDWVVCELSSFQLEDVHTLEPADRRPPQPRARPPRSARDVRALRGREAPDLRAADGRRHRGRAARSSATSRGLRDASSSRLTTSFPAEPRIPGPHNRENAAAATAAARAAGIDDDAIAEALATFEGVPHRIELVRELAGVRYVNDSKATNVAAALRALASFPDERLHVILGGRGKHGVVRAARRGVQDSDRAYLIGEAADEIAAALVDAGVPLRPRRRPRDRS